MGVWYSVHIEIRRQLCQVCVFLTSMSHVTSLCALLLCPITAGCWNSMCVPPCLAVPPSLVSSLVFLLCPSIYQALVVFL